MLSFTKKATTVFLLLGIALVTWADRGVGSRVKAKTSLNIVNSGNLKKSISNSFRSGLYYKGSNTFTHKFSTGLALTSLVSYQKGNITYVIPYKHRPISFVNNKLSGGIKISLK